MQNWHALLYTSAGFMATNINHKIFHALMLFTRKKNIVGIINNFWFDDKKQCLQRTLILIKYHHETRRSNFFRYRKNRMSSSPRRGSVNPFLQLSTTSLNPHWKQKRTFSLALTSKKIINEKNRDIVFRFFFINVS